MALAEKAEIVGRITALAEQAATGTPIEIVEVQLKGAGKARLLRIYIDKVGGVTHGDCQLVSEGLGKLLDDTETLSDDSYTLEVSSPGVDRRLTKARDFERVLGQKVKLSLHNPVAGQIRLDGKLQGISGGVLEIQALTGEMLQIPLDQIQKANLKFEW
ncbi:MAG: ribosome maturation factor RimP [Acidobacteriota bacterium]|nr:ribosome maturation factor RimP [Acidobacteriota bacterium]